MKRWTVRSARTLLALFAAYAVIRGAVELVTIDYANPASYRQDWGGPSLLGVLAVHSGPGLVGGICLVVTWRSRRNAPRIESPSISSSNARQRTR